MDGGRKEVHLLPNNALSRLLYKNLLDEKEQKNHVVLLQGVHKRMTINNSRFGEKLNLPHLQNLQAN